MSTLAVLLSPATAAGASGPDPSRITYTATYTPLDDAGSVSAGSPDEAAGARAGGGRPPGTDFNYHDVTYAECVKHGNSAGKPQWVKNHFALCRRGTVQVVGRDRDTGTPVGTLTYVETIIGYAFQNERSVAFDQYIENIQATGSVKESTTFLVNRWNEGSGNGAILHKGEKHGGVTQVSGGFRGEIGSANEDPSIKSWKKDSMEVLIFDEDQASGTGKDKVHTYDFVPATFFISDGSHNEQLPEPKITVRFDSAPYEKFKKGSIFPGIRATMNYNRADPDVNETAQHIWDAQNHPEKTVPQKAGKKIPGAPSSTPLHRVFYDERLRDQNRKTARAACQAQWPNYSSQGKDCDEYPFSTTKEGAYKAGGNYSARALTSTDLDPSAAFVG
ncbi:NucA/NucB deoxyribonuclease domain-containing protein (plasmid) [Streptomyces sp. FXJ1.172]|uniref:NucA/NucB deoxyribonuclease domain-containing protein n=1 Tax=Streptomyces sp. FXJ1.172 TaxID=710705 RepID=UPI0023DD4D0F|nr:NucA/NucB deoxyribonuclease domain-containing protein [Streptomyces sp. FXJ1.172]WEP00651.1 NucA/NucB deoxyribonuclease domain-containing protein [Streptomyces sp. FXJ1.172]